MDTKRILVVEDEGLTAMHLKANLLELGYEVLTIVASGEEAVQKASELQPDLILMDITLDGPMNGIEAATEIKKSVAIPIIYLTAHTDAATLEQAKTTEPFGYLPKPCSKNAMAATIEMALYKNEADTIRRKAEDELKRVLAEQKIILDNIGVGVLYLKGRKIIWANPALGKMFDYTLPEVQGKDTEFFYSDHKTYLEIGEKAYPALAQGEIYTCEALMRRKDGTLLCCNLVGQAVRPERLEEGTIWIVEDVTGRKGLEAEVTKARNLEALGVLAGGIAHDFNNLLQGLLGNISLARMYTPEASEACKFLQNAEGAYTQAIELTARFVAFSTGGISKWMKFQPADLILEAITSESGSPEVKIEFDFAADLCQINADPVQFRLVMNHLTANAVEAMPFGGRILVMASNEALPSEGAKAVPLAAGNYVRISVQDQGAGISNDNLPRIFDPYFSTKQRGEQKGMGLGLSLCNTIIQKHGGAITVETELGKGSTFHIHLPAVAGVAKKTEASLEKSGRQGHRILIMDDDAGVVQVATEFLGLSGFRVDSALDGDAAITAYQKAHQTGDPYAAVILDLVIPGGMGGKEVISTLKGIDPKVKAIVSSGYASDHAMTDFADYGFVAACAKPYQFKEMIALLERFV